MCVCVCVFVAPPQRQTPSTTMAPGRQVNATSQQPSCASFVTRYACTYTRSARTQHLPPPTAATLLPGNKEKEAPHKPPPFPLFHPSGKPPPPPTHTSASTRPTRRNKKTAAAMVCSRQAHPLTQACRDPSTQIAAEEAGGKTQKRRGSNGGRPKIERYMKRVKKQNFYQSK